MPYSHNALWVEDTGTCSDCFRNLKDEVRFAIKTVKCADRFGFGEWVDQYGLIPGTKRLLPNIKKVVIVVRQRADDVKSAKHHRRRLRREESLSHLVGLGDGLRCSKRRTEMGFMHARDHTD